MPNLVPIETINKDVREYLKQGYTLIGNVSTIQTVPEQHRPAMEMVEVNRDPKFRDVYKQKGGGLSFTHQALKKFANAANIRWLIVEAVPLGCDDRRTTYRAVGRCKALDGTWRESEKAYCFDLGPREDELRNSKKSSANYYMSPQGRTDAPKDFRAKNDQEAKDWVETKVRDEMIQLTKNKVTRAQTGAQDRVVRELLQIKDVYQPEELAKPFLILKLVFVPDLNHPMDRQYVLQENLGSSAALYPGPSPSSVPAPEPRVSLPTYPALTAVPYKDIELTETEQLDSGILPEDVQAPAPSDPPGNFDHSIADFEILDPLDQPRYIKELIDRKDWRGKLSKDLQNFTPSERVQLYTMLINLPNPQGQKAPLPWTNG